MATTPPDDLRRQGLISQIPTDGQRAAPAYDGSLDGIRSSDAGRQALNTAMALPGLGGIGKVAATGGLVSRVLNGAAGTANGAVRVAAGASALPMGAQAEAPAALAPQPGAVAQLQSDPATASNPASPAAPAVSTTNNVTRDGNSYSGANIAGDITINGRAPGSPGSVSAKNMSAADNLAGGQAGTADAASQPTPAAPAGRGVPLVQAAAIRHSGNDWQSRNDLRNAAVSANSIMNTRSWGGPGAENNPAVQEYRAMLGTDQVLRQAQPGMDQSAMRENAALQRTGMQEQGADRRDQRRGLIDSARLGMEQESAGYANRAAGQQEQMRNEIAQEQDPTKRRGLVQRMQETSGRPQADPYLVVPGGQQVDENGRPYNMPSSVFNRQSGQFLQQPGQGGGALPPGMVKQVGTSGGKPVYEDASGKRFGG